jgi:hypothetical protein
VLEGHQQVPLAFMKRDKIPRTPLNLSAVNLNAYEDSKFNSLALHDENGKSYNRIEPFLHHCCIDIPSNSETFKDANIIEANSTILSNPLLLCDQKVSRDPFLMNSLESKAALKDDREREVGSDSIRASKRGRYMCAPCAIM